MNAIPRLKAYSGPALFSYGFRPFFLLGACHAALAIAIWLPLFEGEIRLATLFVPRDWHAHEMLFGYVAAVLTGFLLTGIPNWTGRLPLQGLPLLGLVVAWLAGRVAVACSAHIGWAAAAVVDCGFLVLVVAAISREIIAGRNWRNLKVLVPVSILALANIGFHTEAYLAGIADYAIRASMAAIVVLIVLMGGRLVPSFTRNWLSRENPGRQPASFGPFDVASIALTAASLCVWVFLPDGALTGAALLAAGVLQCTRLARWAGDRTTRERLVLILHVAYAFVPAGLVLAGLGSFGFIAPSAGLHAWMAGGAGTMTLAVMTRASLGHTGRRLAAGAGTQAIYAAVVIAACMRVTGALVPDWSLAMLHVAAAAWIVAFGGFVVLYGPALLRPSASQP